MNFTHLLFLSFKKYKALIAYVYHILDFGTVLVVRSESFSFSIEIEDHYNRTSIFITVKTNENLVLIFAPEQALYFCFLLLRCEQHLNLFLISKFVYSYF